MKTITADKLKAKAAQWYADELERARRAHGTRWPEHEQWVREYLLQEMRERLQRYGSRRAD